MYGTASQVTRWLLLEQDGPWGRDAVLESRIAPDVGRALKARAATLGARLLLIRRHGRPTSARHRLFAALTTPDGGFAESFEVGTPAELLDLDLRGLAGQRPSGGRALDHPLFLVCTNGRHDACCAEFGRPLARALDATHPESTWECSHIGGDRFAANLVCLPEGLYYGQVGALDAAALAEAHLDGRLDLDHYRGRSCLPFVVQAAEYFARREHSLLRIDDLVAVGWEALNATLHRVRFRTSDQGSVTVDLVAEPDPDARWLTCNATRPGRPPRYRLHDILREPARG